MLHIKIAVYVICILFKVFHSIVKTKKPFDNDKKKFSFRRDWWNYKWDDLGMWISGGAIGALLASEIGYPLTVKYLELTGITAQSIQLTEVAVMTLIGSFLFGLIVKD